MKTQSELPDRCACKMPFSFYDLSYNLLKTHAIVEESWIIPPYTPVAG